MKVKGFVFRLLTVSIFVTITLAILELVVRFSNPLQIRRLSVEYHATRGWQNISNAETECTAIEFNEPIRFNSRGLRGPIYPYQKPPNTFRILLIGDSFTIGFGVSTNDRVGGKLQEHLNHAGLQQRVEVISLGTMGYSTDQELIWLREDGLKYQPDLVVLIFHYDDVWDNAQSDKQAIGTTRPKPLFVIKDGRLSLTNVPVRKTAEKPNSRLDRVKDLLYAHSRLYTFCIRALHNSPRLYRMAANAGLTSRRTTPEMEAALQELQVFARKPTPEVETAWETTRLLLRQMQSDVTAAGARFLVFKIPIRERIYPDDLKNLLKEFELPEDALDMDQVATTTDQICSDESIAFLDPAPQFREEAKKGQRLYWKYDGHWNRAGHELAAQALAKYIIEK